MIKRESNTLPPSSTAWLLVSFFLEAEVCDFGRKKMYGLAFVRTKFISVRVCFTQSSCYEHKYQQKHSKHDTATSTSCDVLTYNLHKFHLVFELAQLSLFVASVEEKFLSLALQHFTLLASARLQLLLDLLARLLLKSKTIIRR